MSEETTMPKGVGYPSTEAMDMAKAMNKSKVGKKPSAKISALTVQVAKRMKEQK